LHLHPLKVTFSPSPLGEGVRGVRLLPLERG
jgi:hypothetical protein